MTKSPVKREIKQSSFAHQIITTGVPVSEKFRKIFGEKADTAKSEIQGLLNAGILRSSSSSWASSINVVSKKDGKYGLCGGYRKLNSSTAPDKYPPPLIQDAFKLLNKKSVFTTLDLKKAYHQIPMHRDDIQKTAITTPWSLYEYLVMPIGLKNATQTFQRYMNHIFKDLNFVFIYVDDIIIASKNPEQHRQHLHQVLQKLEDNSLTINIEKCNIGQPEVN